MLTDAVQIALIAAAVPTLGSVILMVLTNRQTIMLKKLEQDGVATKADVADTKATMAETNKAVEETKAAVAEVVLHTNSMKDALVKVTGEAEFAKGLKEGQEGGTASTEAAAPIATVAVPKQTLKVKP